MNRKSCLPRIEKMIRDNEIEVDRLCEESTERLRKMLL